MGEESAEREKGRGLGERSKKEWGGWCRTGIEQWIGVSKITAEKKRNEIVDIEWMEVGGSQIQREWVWGHSAERAEQHLFSWCSCFSFPFVQQVGAVVQLLVLRFFCFVPGSRVEQNKSRTLWSVWSCTKMKTKPYSTFFLDIDCRKNKMIQFQTFFCWHIHSSYMSADCRNIVKCALSAAVISGHFS